jgi:hypothetical protein
MSVEHKLTGGTGLRTSFSVRAVLPLRKWPRDKIYIPFKEERETLIALWNE